MQFRREIAEDLHRWQADAERLRRFAATARSAANSLARHYSAGAICGCDPDGGLCTCRLEEAGYQEEIAAARHLHEAANALNHRANYLSRRIRIGHRILANRTLPPPRLSSAANLSSLSS